MGGLTLPVVLQVSAFPLSAMFGMCSLFLGVAALCQRRLHQVVAGEELAAGEANVNLLPALAKLSPKEKDFSSTAAV